MAALVALETALSSRPAVVELGELAGADKVVHAGYFFLTAVLAVRAGLRSPGSRPGVATLVSTRLGVLVGGIAFGALDELHQSFVPGRTADALDLLADACGTLAAVWIGPRLPWVRRPAGELAGGQGLEPR